MSAYRALVLNADYRPLSQHPLSTVDWEDAVTSVLARKATVVAEYDRYVHSPSMRMRLPSVIALRNYQSPPKSVSFTRFNVFVRDGHRCQYCGEKFPAQDLTFDHVIPRCDGGQTTWENVVAACRPCNVDKDRMHLKPLRVPRKPTAAELQYAKQGYPQGYLHESWVDWLYWSTEIEN